ALFLSMGYNIVLDNFLLSILVGACIGFVLSVIILIVRKFMPKGYGSLGTDVMMGAGNIIGEWFGPIIMLAALKYNFVAGLGSIIGGAICHEKGKPLIGGAILGAMIFGWIFSLIF
ncbi:MAG TPA: hypothetical protein DD429_07285, partial [Clostridiaceae bacterium]|nr:hypothetical protein [Clostridiaceae bacterium]